MQNSRKEAATANDKEGSARDLLKEGVTAMNIVDTPCRRRPPWETKKIETG